MYFTRREGDNREKSLSGERERGAGNGSHVEEKFHGDAKLKKVSLRSRRLAAIAETLLLLRACLRKRQREMEKSVERRAQGLKAHSPRRFFCQREALILVVVRARLFSLFFSPSSFFLFSLSLFAFFLFSMGFAFLVAQELSHVGQAGGKHRKEEEKQR